MLTAANLDRTKDRYQCLGGEKSDDMYAQPPTPDASQIRTPARPWQVRSLSCMAWRAWLAMASGS